MVTPQLCLSPGVRKCHGTKKDTCPSPAKYPYFQGVRVKEYRREPFGQEFAPDTDLIMIIILILGFADVANVIRK